MLLKLRIFFTILSALCVAFALTAGALWGYIWAITLGVGALVFFMAMLLCKQAQEQKEQKEEADKKFFTYQPKEPNPETEDEEM